MKIKNWSRNFFWFALGGLCIGFLSSASISEAQKSQFVKLLMRFGEERVLEDGTKVGLSKGKGDLIAVTISKPDNVINFPANREGWQSIGSGTFTLNVSGQIDIGGVIVSPKGWSKLGDDTALVAGLPFGAIIAKIGNGKPFLVGDNYKFDTQEQVYIAINDSDYSDNTGSFKVHIKR